MTLTENFESISDPETVFTVWISSKTDILEQPEYRFQLVQTNLARLKIEQQRKTLLPTVSFYSRLGVLALGKKFNDTGQNELSWYFNSYIGLRTQWSLNSILDNRHTLPQLELKLRQSELHLAERQRSLAFAEMEAKSKLTHALEDYRIQKRREVFAEKELNYLLIRFEGDLASAKDVVRAEEDLSVAQRAVLTAYYGYLAARWELTMESL
jgi:outer membrane protein TolC